MPGFSVGRQGGDEITADEIAEQLGTISHEVITSIPARVPRLYLQHGQVVGFETLPDALICQPDADSERCAA